MNSILFSHAAKTVFTIQTELRIQHKNDSTITHFIILDVPYPTFTPQQQQQKTRKIKLKCNKKHLSFAYSFSSFLVFLFQKKA